MQAARLHEYGKPLVIDDPPKPTPAADRTRRRVSRPHSISLALTARSHSPWPAHGRPVAWFRSDSPAAQRT